MKIISKIITILFIVLILSFLSCESQIASDSDDNRDNDSGGSGGTSLTGNVTAIDSYSGLVNSKSICGDDKFIYVAGSVWISVGGMIWETGIYSFIVTDDGYLIQVDFKTQGNTIEANDVWCDGNFIYLANGTGGLHTYSVNSSGVLNHIHSYDPCDSALNVWGDGNFIYLTSGENLYSYKVE